MALPLKRSSHAVRYLRRDLRRAGIVTSEIYNMKFKIALRFSLDAFYPPPLSTLSLASVRFL
jgi:hypothetical protein